MRVTKDTHTGRPFRWNATVLYGGLIVPARVTRQGTEHLHPTRVPAELLVKLNPGSAKLNVAQRPDHRHQDQQP